MLEYIKYKANLVIVAGYGKVTDFDNFKHDMSDGAGQFDTILGNATEQLNSAYTVLKTFIFIAAICVLYLGLAYFAKAKSGQEESQAKEMIRRAVFGVSLMSMIGSFIMAIFTAATSLSFT